MDPGFRRGSGMGYRKILASLAAKPIDRNDAYRRMLAAGFTSEESSGINKPQLRGLRQ